MKRLLAPACLLALLHASLSGATLTLNPASSAQITKARSVGINVEMAFISDQMRTANGNWFEETLDGCAFNALRWGYGAWEWDWEKEVSLTFDYWTAYNIGNDADTYGLKEFLSYCKASNRMPMLMIPCEVEKYPETSWADVKTMAGAMATYVNAQGLSTPVYFELGNEPAFTLSQAVYEARVADMSPVIKGVNPAFKYGATVDGSSGYNPVTLITNVGSSIDFIDFHRYPAVNFWTGFYNNDNDLSISHPGISKESFLGETNVLWPNWSGRMANDFQASLPLLNLLLARIEANVHQYITTWPTIYPGTANNEPYGLFNYDAWFMSRQTVLFTGPIYAHRMVNENVLDYRVTSRTSSDAKIRLAAFTDATASKMNVFVINKRSTTESLTFNTTQAYAYVQAFIFKGTSLATKSPTYEPLIAAMTPVGSATFNTTIPPECAVVYRFYNDSSVSAPGAFSLSGPDAAATGVSTFKTFKWSAAANAQSYRLTIATNSAFTSPVFDREVGPLLQYQVVEPFLNASTTYYWKVVAKNKIGQTNATGNGRSFTTDAPSTAPYWSGAPANFRFEEGLIAWTNWGATARTSTPGEVISGAYSAKTGPASGGFGQDVFGLAPGGTYQLHTSTRATSALDEVSVGATFFNAARAQISETIFTLPQTTNLVNAVHSLTIPANTARTSIWIWKDGANGHLFSDDITTANHSLDNTAGAGVTTVGTWTATTTGSPFVGTNYVTDGNAGKGTKTITFSPTVPATGAYDVFVSYVAAADRASNVPVTVTHAAGTSSVTLNQKTGGGWFRLGSWNFNAGTAGSVRLSNTGTNGFVVADAVRLSPILLHNPGFEDVDKYWTNWGNASSQAGNAHGGARAIRMGTGAGGRGQNVPSAPGITYTLGGWGKVSAAGEMGWIGITAYSASHVELGRTGIEFTTTHYTTDSVPFTTPAGTSYVNIWVWKDAGVGGYFYADDVYLFRQ